jgi:hypothetical protein
MLRMNWLGTSESSSDPRYRNSEPTSVADVQMFWRTVPHSTQSTFVSSLFPPSAFQFPTSAQPLGAGTASGTGRRSSR